MFGGVDALMMEGVQCLVFRQKILHRAHDFEESANIVYLGHIPALKDFHQLFETFELIWRVMSRKTESEVERHHFIIVVVKMGVLDRTGARLFVFPEQFVAMKNEAVNPSVHFFVFVEKIFEHCTDKLLVEVNEAEHHIFWGIIFTLPKPPGLRIFKAPVVHGAEVKGLDVPVFLKGFLRLPLPSWVVGSIFRQEINIALDSFVQFLKVHNTDGLSRANVGLSN